MKERADSFRTRIDPGSVLRWVRRLTLVTGLVTLGYLWTRLDSFVLDGPCSPLVRIAPGTRLVIDRRPPRYRPSDLVFFEGPAGRIHIGELQRLEADQRGQRYWIETDAADCPGLGSDELGWIVGDRMRGRVVFASGDW